MRLTDPRVLTTLILGMMFTGVFAYAVYTASLDGSVFQAPTIKADVFYVGAQTLNNYILSVAPGGAGGFYPQPSTYLIYKTGGGTYVSQNQLTGVNSTNANFVTLINTVFSACSAGDTIHVKAGSYVVGATITGQTGVNLSGEGYGTIFGGSTMAASDTMIEYTGVSGAAVNLSANAAILDNHVHVAAGDEAGFAAGDLVFINSSAVWDGNTLNQKQGEFFHVGSTGVGLVNLVTYESLMGTYATASTAHLHKVTPVRDFVIENIHLTGDGATAVDGIYITNAENVVVRGVSALGVNRRAIAFTNVLSGKVTGCSLNEINQAGFGYGVVLEYASQGIVVSDNTFFNCRHAVAIGGGSLAGIPRGISVNNNYASSSSADANYDCHDVGESITFSNNVSLGGSYGFAIRAHTVVVSGNVVNGAATVGIQLDSAEFDSCLVSLNSVMNTPTAIRTMPGSVNIHLIYNDLGNCGTGVNDDAAGTQIVSLS